MHRSLLLLTLSLALAAGCAPKGKIPTVPGAIGKDGATLVHDGGVVYNNPFGVPTRVSVELPKALLIGPGGGNYRTLAEKSWHAKAVLDNVELYKGSTKLIEEILGAMAKHKPVPGKSYTFDDDKGQEMTVLMEILDDHALVSIGRGKDAKGEGQMISIAYTSPTRGRAILRTPKGEGDGGIHFATTYDLEAGSASAEGILDGLDNPAKPERIAGHWEFKSHQQAKADELAFEMQISAHVYNANKPKEAGYGAFSCHFLPDSTGAFIMGFQNAGTQNKLVFAPSDGVSWGDPDAPRAFYLDGQGNDIAPEDAPAALKAILPGQDTIYRPFPGDPAEGDPFDGRLEFPAKVK